MNKPKDLNAPSRWNMRIWDDDKKEWLCQSDKDAITYYGFDITGGETTEFQGLPKWHPDRHLIWEQSTGLKDKNGKEIYEGDIVSKDSLSGEYGALFVVKYGGSCDIDISGHHYCPFIRGFYLDEMCEYDKVDEDGYMEVIGNVHEDKELLGGGE